MCIIFNHVEIQLPLEHERKKQAMRKISLKDLVYQMRQQRHPWMVEKLHQYTLAYDIVIYLLKQMIENDK